MEKPCRIILVDDHTLFRNGLRGLLAACDEYEVVGEAASGEEFLAMLPRWPPTSSSWTSPCRAWRAMRRRNRRSRCGPS